MPRHAMATAGWALLGLAGACTDGGPPGDGPDPTDPCAHTGAAALELGQRLSTEGVATDGGDVGYGQPPQGGAPFTPYEIRLKADLGEAELPLRMNAWGEAHERGTGELLGDVEQPSAFFCSNTGVHEGWLYGGEVHVRFWGWALEDLEGKDVDITVGVDLPDGTQVLAETSGPLVWSY